jgi:hypothetical protein
MKYLGKEKKNLDNDIVKIEVVFIKIKNLSLFTSLFSTSLKEQGEDTNRIIMR